MRTCNLIPVCSRHHHTIHDFGWRLDLSPDRTLTIRRPGGEFYTTCRPDALPDGGALDSSADRGRRRRTPAA